VAESGKWVCDKCRSERLRILEEKLQGALLKIDALTRKNTGRTSTNFDSGKGSWQA
jgi:hypothetical protein